MKELLEENVLFRIADAAHKITFGTTSTWESGCGGQPFKYCGQCGGIVQDNKCTVCGTAKID